MVQNNKNIEPQTTFTATVHISAVTTAGRTKNGNGYYDIEVPSRGPNVVVEWSSTTDSLDELIDKAHQLLKLYGGTIGFIIDAPHGRGVMDLSQPPDFRRTEQL